MSLSDTQPGTLEIALSLGVLEKEYEHVCQALGRQPNYAELGIFSSMFSEHCSYKSSKAYLKKLPTEGKRVIQGPGENAGVVDIGNGWAVAFKMESHNHPSYIEPFQGAATGVGGILRDVFTMGARPVASMDALYFGLPQAPRMEEIIRGVVRGVGHYGNCVGVPTVGGQTTFLPCYNQNPLVNAMTVGLVRHEGVFLGEAKGVGNLVMYVGAKTGRDGVHGASMASQEFSTEVEPERPTVQVGDPFTEKLLLEATLEIMDKKLVEGIQDMGAAGLTSSSFEMAERSKTGVFIDLDKIPVREKDLTAFELLLSESQERMLLVALPENERAIREVYDKWDLHAEVVGKVVEGNRVEMVYQGQKVVDLPVSLVAEPLMRNLPTQRPPFLELHWNMDEEKIKNTSLEKKFELLTQDLHFASVIPLTQQYDSMVGNRTVEGSQEDAAVIWLRDIKEGGPYRLAISTDCQPVITYLDPREGGRRSICEAALNLACKGARPLAVTDCLNFGSPENPEVLWQFRHCIEGMMEACLALESPVVSGNVSLYNETDGKPIYPTPSIGMVGLIEGDHALAHSSFFQKHLTLGLIGPLDAGLGGSRMASLVLQKDGGRPSSTDLIEVRKTVLALGELAKIGIPIALHDISQGGLLLALTKMCCLTKEAKKEGVGIFVQVPEGIEEDRFLFGESLPRVLIAFPAEHQSLLEKFFKAKDLSFSTIGNTQVDTQIEIKTPKSSHQIPLEPLYLDWKSKWERFFN